MSGRITNEQRVKNRQYYLDNRERMKRERQDYYAAHAEECRRWMREYRQTHPERHWAVRTKNLHGHEIDEETIKYVAMLLRDPCAYCGSRDRITIDHIVPASKGGLSHWSNLTAACKRCNARKSAGSVEKLLRIVHLPTKVEDETAWRRRRRAELADAA